MADLDTLDMLSKLTAEGCSLGDAITIAAELSQAGKPAVADQVYKIWARFNPEHPQLCVALFNRSVLQSALGDNAGAAASLEQALARNPDFMPAYVNLGGLQERAGLHELAVATWEAGANRPAQINGMAANYVFTCLKQIARLLGDIHQPARAEMALQRAADLDPAAMDVIGQLVATRLSQCKWPALVPSERLSRETLLRGVNPLSIAAYTDDPLLLLAAASAFIAREAKTTPDQVRADRRDAPIDLTGRRPRIGYISSDLRDHAVGYLMAELFEVHDREKVEVFAYYCGPESSDGLNTRIRAAAEHFIDIRPMTDDEAAQRIVDDGIDILVDVNGHTRDARTAVFARRPAPVLVNWLGYPGTMGSDYHHYIIADPWIIPEEMERYYSEAVRRIPCYQPNDRRRKVQAECPTRAEAGLPEDAFVFCCFNGTQKITPHVFDRWMEILRRTPGSVLWLLDSNPEANARLRDSAEAQGVDRTRLIFAPKLQNAYHLARYRLADLFLDTTPYGAHTTASDALWMAVPVLTWSGRSFASRVCGSLVRSAGTPELVVDTGAAYVEKAVELGADREKAKALRATLEANRDTCVLFDMDLLATSLETLYGEMIAEHQAGQRPSPDLTNLDVYLSVGLELDEDRREMQAVEDYEGLYRAALARRHLVRAVPVDNRVWTLDARQTTV
ncbi:N-acetylglucosamine transferase [Caulobacter sp.]|uniref:O-linked N-acetylglucosamine transferase, SPINDLY family protein n=1 Tax=Caulobacter sp. TaxID=78 RepID=UPI002B4A5FB3|nr:N-acetylglucosamine transferase [Caulobacter sp.]HJV40420.1 N-acetylglucosamine transferase [Caulobacter sp.]